ncbi:hypothetical protein GCM10007916_35540 [Psychromonas marina]|uniref:Outer membrane protein beta-barrel domain-containing protein n=1 Tax=Psychromonas marina TaxID=88364 RepID=A0ABQ6E4V4_9GAMM|nr:hypothetical protein [Psychromonas marina]GLS92482.1 hypothetical protein GCM10007916_35540 [Psychromonas marina]
MKQKLSVSLLLLPALAFAEVDKKNAQDKLSEDPTKVTTKIGVSYKNNYDLDNSRMTFSGSLALDPIRKINASVNEDGSDWRIGGSWLFDIGIVNFSFGQKEFTTGAKQNSYSVGTFVPLSSFGIEPFGMQIFPMAGYTYNDGEVMCEKEIEDCSAGRDDPLNPDFMFVSSEAHSGYVGAFALKPLMPDLTWIMFGLGSMGSNDYRGYGVGTGLGYTLSKHHSISTYTAHMDNSFGTDTVFGFAYSYQFN